MEQINKISFTEYASGWNEAFPVGNGRMGAMVFGRPKTELLQLNEDSMWYGGPRDRINPSAAEYLPRIREAIQQGWIQEAQDMCALTLSGVPDSLRHYETLGNLYILFDGDEEGISEYRRELDLENATVTISYVQNGIRYTRQIIASNPDEAILIKISADQEHAIGFHTQLTRGNITWDLSPYEKQVYRNPGYNDYADDCKNVDLKTTVMSGRCGGEGSVSYACGLRVKQVGGSLESIGNSLVVRESTEVVIAISAATTYYQDEPKAEVLRVLNQLDAQAYEHVLKRHITDYQSLYNRVTLELPETEWDVVRLFNFGRYLMIAGSRPGSLPLNLQGIWNCEHNPAWGSKYTININTEMNYWPAEVCNLSECHEPLFDLIHKMLPSGRENARRMYRCGGFMAHHNTDLWGDCAPQDVCLSSTYWVMGAAWLCLHIWDHYDYTQDLDFLQNNYPIMLEAAEFICDYLVEDGPYLVTNPTLSPENEYILPNGEHGVLCKGATMDNQIIVELFTACRKAAAVLEPTEKAQELLERMQVVMSKLAPMKINSYGGIQEWNEDYQELEPGHRHISHLFGLYPGHTINADTPELMAAAHKTLARRLSSGGGHTGWSRAWIINMYARLGDGNAAYEHVRLLMEKSLLPNLFDNHPPFQIDGNFGFVSGVAEMLVQGDSEHPVLLPAIPECWKEKGSVSGLKLRGGKVLEMSWRDGKVIDYTIS